MDRVEKTAGNIGALDSDLIYGFFTVEREGDMTVKRWHPSPMVGLTARQQFNHNRTVDPEFKILQIRDKQVA